MNEVETVSDTERGTEQGAAPLSAYAPRPRAGFTSRDDDEIPTERWVSFIAAALRACIGALFVFMAMLYLPVHMMTPILTGMGILMVANGLLATWKLGRTAPRMAMFAKILVYGVPALVVLMFVALGVLGPASLGPDWSALREARSASS